MQQAGYFDAMPRWSTHELLLEAVQSESLWLTRLQSKTFVRLMRPVAGSSLRGSASGRAASVSQPLPHAVPEHAVPEGAPAPGSSLVSTSPCLTSCCSCIRIVSIK
jgi:hypothetical protein